MFLTTPATPLNDAHPGGFLFCGGKFVLKYTKPPLTAEQQLELLQSRGMQIADKGGAISALTHINYYRLRAYWIPHEIQAEKPGEHKFKEGTTLESILELYEFDRKLRMLLLAAIERLEVSVRTRMAQVLSMKYGSHAHLLPDIFNKASKHSENIGNLQEEMNRSHETFIDHYMQKYTDPDSPPIWVATEIMSLGLLSKFYDNIKTYADRGDIAKTYGIHSDVLGSFLHHITHVRNFCAHHCRVWNRRFVIKFKIPMSPSYLTGWLNKEEGPERNVYNTLAMLVYLMRTIDPAYQWFDRLKEMIGASPGINKAAMGFPENWEKMQPWRD